MNTLKMISIALLSSLLVGTTVLASENTKVSTVKVTSLSVRQQLANVLSDIATDETGYVQVSFSISPDKTFKLNGVEGFNDDLNDIVEAAVKDADIDVTDLNTGKYVIDFDFN